MFTNLVGASDDKRLDISDNVSFNKLFRQLKDTK